MNCNRTYKIETTITEISGLAGVMLKGAKVEIDLLLTASSETYESFQGEAIISGKINKAVSASGDDLTSMIGDNLSFGPEPWSLNGKELKGNASGDWGTVNFDGTISDDWSRVRDIQITAQLKGEATQWANSAKMEGGAIQVSTDCPSTPQDESSSQSSELSEQSVVENSESSQSVIQPEESSASSVSSTSSVSSESSTSSEQIVYSKMYYDTNLTISRAKGFIGKKIKGAKAKLEIRIEGDPQDFSNPVGKTFAFSWKLLSVASVDGEDLISKAGAFLQKMDFDFEHIPIKINGYNFSGSKKTDDVTFTYSGSISKDWSRIDNLVIKGSAKNIMVSILLRDPKLEGACVFTHGE